MLATNAHAALSGLPPVLAASSGMARYRSTAASCKRASRSTVLGPGSRPRTRRSIQRARPAVPSVSFSARPASAIAASAYTGSFKVTKACNGVLVGIRRAVHISRLDASNVRNDGYGLVRLQYV